MTLSTDQKKKLVLDFLHAIGRNDAEGCIALMNEDAIYRVPGKPELFPAAGAYDVPSFRKWLNGFEGAFDGPILYTVKGWTIDGDRAAVELLADAKTKDGKTYDQTYHFAFTFRGDKIQSATEYLDTLFVAHLFGLV